MAVAFDAKTAAWTWSSTSPISANNLTVGSGSNRGLLFFVMRGDSGLALPTGLTLTWDLAGANQTLTQIPGTLVTSTGVTAAAAIYGLLNPASLNKTLTVSWTGTANVQVSGASYTGVDQTSIAVAFPHGGIIDSPAGSASPCSITITSATGNMVVAAHAQQFSVWGAISGTTIATDTSSDPNIGTASHYDNGAASVTLTAAYTGTGTNLSIGCDILAASGGAAVKQRLIEISQAIRRASYW